MEALLEPLLEVSSGQCIDFSAALSFRFSDVPSTAIPCLVVAWAPRARPWLALAVLLGLSG